MAKRRRFGAIRTLPSGRVQASYMGPDNIRHRAPVTFDAEIDAEAFLTDARRSIQRGEWTPAWQWGAVSTVVVAAPKVPTFESYANDWLEHRDLKPRTRNDYRTYLDKFLIPEFGTTLLPKIKPDDVRRWHSKFGSDRAQYRSKVYSLLRTILGNAEQDREIEFSPCHIRGAGNVKRTKKPKPATVAELDTMVDAIAPRLRAMLLLGAWCSLRYGEVTELRRKDIDLKAGVVHVLRGVVRVPGGFVVGPPKSEAGVRDVSLPPHLVPILREHLAEHTSAGREALLFPAADGKKHLGPSTFYKHYYPARAAADRDDLAFHDLRHTGAMFAAGTGAPLVDVMDRLGHSTVGAAMRYQHASADRGRLLADKLSEFATRTVTGGEESEESKDS